MRVPAERRLGMFEGMPAVPAARRPRPVSSSTSRPPTGLASVKSGWTTRPPGPPVHAAAAVVTDGGSLATRASLAAREYGILAPLALLDANQRIRDGLSTTLDLGPVLVELHG